MELAGGEAFLGGAEGVEEAGGEVDFAGEEAVATAVEIGHGKVLLELVMHNNENINETIGPRAGIIVVRKISYYASSRQQDHKKKAIKGGKTPFMAAQTWITDDNRIAIYGCRKSILLEFYARQIYK